MAGEKQECINLTSLLKYFLYIVWSVAVMFMKPTAQSVTLPPHESINKSLLSLSLLNTNNLPFFSEL